MKINALLAVLALLIASCQSPHPKTTHLPLTQRHLRPPSRLPNLHKHPQPNLAPIPNDDVNDTQVGLDDDENLPWPDVEKVTALWRNHGANFRVGRRYFLGKPITPEWLKHKITEGTMRQRHAAALELALMDPPSRLVNTHARVTA